MSTSTLVILIINIRDKLIQRETLIYWRNIIPKYNFIFFGFMGTNHNKLVQNNLIKRISGDFVKLKSEIDEIKYLKYKNQEWVDAWKRVKF